MAPRVKAVLTICQMPCEDALKLASIYSQVFLSANKGGCCGTGVLVLCYKEQFASRFAQLISAAMLVLF